MNHVTKQGFYKMLCEENSVFGEVSVLLVVIQFFCGVGGEGGWGVGGCLLTSSAFRMGAYSGWVLIRG